MIARGGVDSIVETIARAKGVQQLKYALAPLQYRDAPPHEDFMAALCAAGGTSAFKTILRTHPTDAYLTLLCQQLLSVCVISAEEREECAALVANSRACIAAAK